MAAALVLLTVVGFAAVTWQWRRASSALHETQGALAANHVLLAHQEWSLKDLDRADHLLDGCKPEFRGWEWHYLKGLCHPLLRRIRGHAAAPMTVAFAPDGRQVATASRDCTVKLWDVVTGEEVLTLRHAEPVWSLAFSPDGRHLATGSGRLPPDATTVPDGEVTVWDLTTATAIRKHSGHAGQLNSVAFSPDGRRLASPARDDTVRIWDVQTGTDLVVVRGADPQPSAVAFSPDGRRLACGRGRFQFANGSRGGASRVTIADATTGKELRTLADTDCSCVAFSPDGKLLATSDGVWDTATGNKRFSLPNQTSRLGSVAFSPDGQRIALSSGLEGSMQAISILDVATAKTLLSPRAPIQGMLGAVAFSPDGLRLASVSLYSLDPRQQSEVVELDLWDGSCGHDARLIGQHRLPVSGVAFDPDGRRLAAVSALPYSQFDDRAPLAPGGATLWDVARGRELLTLEPKNDFPLAMAVSPDGQRIAAASYDDAVIVWDTESGEKLHTFRGHAGLVRSVAFSPDSARLASAADDKTVRLWDARSGQELLPPMTGHKEAPSHVCFSPDGKRIVSTVGLYYRHTFDHRGFSVDPGGLAETRVWDATNGQPLATIQEGWGGAAFSPDGRLLATGSLRNGVVLRDMTTGKEVSRLSPNGRGRASSVCWSANGGRIAALFSEFGSPTGPVKVWDVTSKRELFSDERHFVLAAALSPDGERLAWASKRLQQEQPTIHDLRTNKPIKLTRHGFGVYALAWFPDGRRIATASSDQTVRIWDARDGRTLRILRGRPEAAHAIAWGPDGRLASASFDHNIRIWSPGSREPDRVLAGHTANVHQLAWRPDGQQLASAGEDGAVKVWDGASGREVHSLSGHTGAVYSVSWSPDGSRLASGGADKSIRLWDTTTGQLLAILGQPDMATVGQRGPFEVVVWSPDGGHLAAAERTNMGTRRLDYPYAGLWGCPIKVWDVRGRPREVPWREPQGTVPTGFFAWSPDGKRLATWVPSQPQGGAVHLWDVQTGRATSLAWDASLPCALAFSPDGTRIAAAGTGKRVTLWNASTGQEVLTLRGHADWVTALAFSRDGHRLASGGIDGTVRVWDATPLDERAVRTAPLP
jgi:WD40 repeat protein